MRVVLLLDAWLVDGEGCAESDFCALVSVSCSFLLTFLRGNQCFAFMSGWYFVGEPLCSFPSGRSALVVGSKLLGKYSFLCFFQEQWVFAFALRWHYLLPPYSLPASSAFVLVSGQLCRA